MNITKNFIWTGFLYEPCNSERYLGHVKNAEYDDDD